MARDRQPDSAEETDRARWSRRVAEHLDLPQDIVLNLPRMVILGDLQLVIENHGGVAEYDDGERLVVDTGSGRVAIEGEELVIGAIYDEEITVTGRIQRLTFDR